MKKSIKQLFSGVLASFSLTVLLSVKAYADDLEPKENTAPPTEIPSPLSALEPLPEIVAEQNEPGLTGFSGYLEPNDDAADQAENPSDIEPLPEIAAEQNELGLSGFSAYPESEPKPLLLAAPASASEEQSASAVGSSLKVGTTEIGDADESSGWDSGTSSGWRYDSESGTVSLVNCSNAVEISAENGVELSVAGLNHIDKLYSNGNVNITGTGIVLIDSIDMLEGTSLNLLTPGEMYTQGSAAVFLKQEDGTYLLINGDVPGILDEAYTLPEGVELVVPDGGKLEMKVNVGVKTRVEDWSNGLVNESYHNGIGPGEDARYEENGDIRTYRSLYSTVSKLTVPEGSGLTINTRASLTLGSLRQFYGTSTYNLICSLDIFGRLGLDGTIVGSGNGATGKIEDKTLRPEVVLESTASLSGEGSFENLALKYNYVSEAKETVNLRGVSRIDIRGKGPDTLYVNGDTAIVYSGNSELGNVSVSSGSTALVYTDNAGKLNINGNISISGKLNVITGIVYNKGNLYRPVFENPKEAFDYPILVDICSAYDVYYSPVLGYFYEADIRSDASISLERTDEPLNFEKLQEATRLYPDVNDKHAVFGVYVYEGGKVSLIILDEYSNEEIDRSKVLQIWAAEVIRYDDNYGGTPIVTTNTSNTGSGILGGSNAGKFNGTGSKSVHSGTRSASEETPTHQEPTNPPADPSDPGDGEGQEDQGTEDTGNGESTEDTGDGEGTEDGEETDGTEGTEDGEDTGDDENEVTESTSANSITVRITGSGLQFRLEAFDGGMRVNSLSAPVGVSVRARIPENWNTNMLLAVFRDANGILTAIRAEYDSASGLLYFDTTLLGNFEIVYFDWSGYVFGSSDFYAALNEMLLGGDRSGL